jgi:hypothetical protein
MNTPLAAAAHSPLDQPAPRIRPVRGAQDQSRQLPDKWRFPIDRRIAILAA